MRADLGVMLSASHNPYYDNGIKLFGPDGYKLSDEDEAQIEYLLAQNPPLAEPAHIGRAKAHRGRARALYPCGEAEPARDRSASTG